MRKNKLICTQQEYQACQTIARCYRHYKFKKILQKKINKRKRNSVTSDPPERLSFILKTSIIKAEQTISNLEKTLAEDKDIFEEHEVFAKIGPEAISNTKSLMKVLDEPEFSSIEEDQITRVEGEDEEI